MPNSVSDDTSLRRKVPNRRYEGPHIRPSKFVIYDITYDSALVLGLPEGLVTRSMQLAVVQSLFELIENVGRLSAYRRLPANHFAMNFPFSQREVCLDFFRFGYHEFWL